MTRHLEPKTALAVAAVGLFLPFGAVLPAVVGAAPSSSSAAKLRECLRASADMHQTTFGGRYVTAEDVARCMEAFRPGSSGGASKGGSASPPTSTSREEGGKASLPEHFGITSEGVFHDCRITGNSVACTSTMQEKSELVDSYTGTITGTLSGLTMTGTLSSEMTTVPEGGCVSHGTYSAPVTFTFSNDGTVLIRVGPIQTSGTSGGGTCSGAYSTTSPSRESTGRWSAIN